MANEQLLKAASALGITKIGGHPVASLEAARFLNETPEARAGLKRAVHGVTYGLRGADLRRTPAKPSSGDS